MYPRVSNVAGQHTIVRFAKPILWCPVSGVDLLLSNLEGQPTGVRVCQAAGPLLFSLEGKRSVVPSTRPVYCTVI
jgi:hypothetical protein